MASARGHPDSESRKSIKLNWVLHTSNNVGEASMWQQARPNSQALGRHTQPISSPIWFRELPYRLLSTMFELFYDLPSLYQQATKVHRRSRLQLPTNANTFLLWHESNRHETCHTIGANASSSSFALYFKHELRQDNRCTIVILTLTPFGASSLSVMTMLVSVTVVQLGVEDLLRQGVGLSFKLCRSPCSKKSNFGLQREFEVIILKVNLCATINLEKLEIPVVMNILCTNSFVILQLPKVKSIWNSLNCLSATAVFISLRSLYCSQFKIFFSWRVFQEMQLQSCCNRMVHFFLSFLCLFVQLLIASLIPTMPGLCRAQVKSSGYVWAT